NLESRGAAVGGHHIAPRQCLGSTDQDRAVARCGHAYGRDRERRDVALRNERVPSLRLTDEGDGAAGEQRRLDECTEPDVHEDVGLQDGPGHPAVAQRLFGEALGSEEWYG